MKLIFATSNENKAVELQKLMGDTIEIESLKSLNFMQDIVESEDTLEGNSLLKANTVFNHFNRACFADDTGLEVDALDGAPGVYSARYAGPTCDSENNMALLLRNLGNTENLKARFRTVITFKSLGTTKQFEGIVDGNIVLEKRGSKGFGYDPIFKPNLSELTFGEMTLKQKNEFSHRARAFAKLKDYLLSIDSI
ncbi:MAG: RdgB/HAM1 family non-canonical purine NTP pyrophosphatase [Crocinitomicaceae bacterium]|nr:RdgB/HAM1 family non-canonical purine NTP pyrophosphatase [Crocinitomicaceae bacterium]